MERGGVRGGDAAPRRQRCPLRLPVPRGPAVSASCRVEGCYRAGFPVMLADCGSGVRVVVMLCERCETLVRGAMEATCRTCLSPADRCAACADDIDCSTCGAAIVRRDVECHQCWERSLRPLCAECREEGEGTDAPAACDSCGRDLIPGSDHADLDPDLEAPIPPISQRGAAATPPCCLRCGTALAEPVSSNFCWSCTASKREP